ncbi:MAG TPA: AMP-binding protein [Solirubrobacteraceae bacterium]|nr:AMP-binding protein [Solirubrobacteraceae bacterium]
MTPSHTRSVCALLDARAASAPDAPAISFRSGEFTYDEVQRASVIAARRLLGAGVRPGDRVGILLRDACEPYVATGLGAVRIGAIVVPINARNKVRELEYVIGHSGLRLLLTESEFLPMLDEAEIDREVRIVDVAGDRNYVAGGDGVDEARVAELEAAVSPDSPSLLLYTSGTTANPKGCLHTHATMLASGSNTAGRLELTPADRYWTALAMFHVGGWQVLMANITAGSCFSHAGIFDATAALDQLERERVTVAMPAFELIWMGVLNHERFPTADLSALRTVMNVGVPERMARMQAMVPQAVQVSMIGMTECLGSICIGSRHDSEHSRMHTSGRPLPGMEVRIVDPATGEDLPRNTPGELLFRGVSKFVEYYRDPETTAAVVDEEGWVRTGDLAIQDEEDCVSFVSRLKDMLKVGGENASAAEIEGYLITHPAVAMAAVVAAPDERYGEVPAAFVQLRPDAEATEQELIDYCVGKIATFKVPRYVRFVDNYPTAASAKIQKYVLREQIAAELRERGISQAPKIVTRR